LKNGEEGEKPVTENRSTIRYTAKVSSPSIQVILVVFVALFILFLWLNFVLTQEIESIGREIQAKTEELQVIERRQGVLLKEISVIGSQERMAEQAWLVGYRPQTPVYLSVAEPLGQAASEATEYGGQPAASVSAGEQSAERTRSLWDLLAHQGGTLVSETTP
jgi:cell division protein FtsB